MQTVLSEIRIFGFPFAPKGWALCNGATLAINGNQALFSLLGTRFGGSESTFKLPDLRDRVMIHSGPGYPAFATGGEELHLLKTEEMPKHRHQAVASSNVADTASPEKHFWPSDMGYVSKSDVNMSDQSTEAVGGDLPHYNMSPFLAVNYCIAVVGIYPTDDFHAVEEYTGAIKPFSKNLQFGLWLPCDGRELPVINYMDLYGVIGGTFGGNGSTTFALPDLRGRATVAPGAPADLSHYELGQKAGEASVKLTTAQLPKHSHLAQANTRGNSQLGNDKVWANDELRPAPSCFTTSKGNGAVMNNEAIGEIGGDAAHNNMMLYQTMEFMICTKGIFPNPE